MIHFYDGQLRKYITQIIRMLSGFKYKTIDGQLITIPVIYGDMSRQVAAALKDFSENSLIKIPCIAVYIDDLQLDVSMLSDATFVSKLQVRERDIDEVTGTYKQNQGLNYTVERLMPTPYKLTCKADICSTNTDQKLQILEQLLMLFNPSIEIQSSDNFVDWSSLTTVYLENVTFSSRTIPQGTDSQLDIATLTLVTPIYISPPVKVKKMQIITDIIMNIYDDVDYLKDWCMKDDIYHPLVPDTVARINIGGFTIFVINNKVSITRWGQYINVNGEEIIAPLGTIGQENWRLLLDIYPGKFKSGHSILFLKQHDGTEVAGVLSMDPLNEKELSIVFDVDSFPSNTVIVGPVITGGSVDAIIDPTTFNPRPIIAQAPTAGTRYLLTNDLGSLINTDGADAWASWDITNPSAPVKLGDFVAKANDIIEFDGQDWVVVWEAAVVEDIAYVTNIRTGIQYKWNGVEWIRSFEGEYSPGMWRMVL